MSIIYEIPTIFFGVLDENRALTHLSGKPTLTTLQLEYPK